MHGGGKCMILTCIPSRVENKCSACRKRSLPSGFKRNLAAYHRCGFLCSPFKQRLLILVSSIHQGISRWVLSHPPNVAIRRDSSVVSCWEPCFSGIHYRCCFCYWRQCSLTPSMLLDIILSLRTGTLIPNSVVTRHSSISKIMGWAWPCSNAISQPFFLPCLSSHPKKATLTVSGD